MKREFSLCPHGSSSPLAYLGVAHKACPHFLCASWCEQGWRHCSNSPASRPTYWSLRQKCLPWDCLRGHVAFTGNISSVTSAAGLPCEPSGWPPHSLSSLLGWSSWKSLFPACHGGLGVPWCQGLSLFLPWFPPWSRTVLGTQEVLNTYLLS